MSPEERAEKALGGVAFETTSDRMAARLLVAAALVTADVEARAQAFADFESERARVREVHTELVKRAQEGCDGDWEHLCAEEKGLEPWAYCEPCKAQRLAFMLEGRVS